MNSCAYTMSPLSLSVDTNASCSGKVVISSNFFLCIVSQNTILNILGLLGVPKFQNMYTLAQWEHGNVYGNGIGTWECVWKCVWERGWELVWEHGSVYEFPMSSPLTSQKSQNYPKVPQCLISCSKLFDLPQFASSAPILSKTSKEDTYVSNDSWILDAINPSKLSYKQFF